MRLARKRSLKIVRAIVLFLVTSAATSSQAADAVTLAARAVKDFYVNPLRLANVVLQARTDYFEPGADVDSVYIDVYESRTCCVPVPDSQPLLTFAILVRDGRLRNVSASGRLIDSPTGRSVANSDEVEREAVAAVMTAAKLRRTHTETRHNNGRAIRRVTCRPPKGASVLGNDCLVIVDVSSGLPTLIELP